MTAFSLYHVVAQDWIGFHNHLWILGEAGIGTEIGENYLPSWVSDWSLKPRHKLCLYYRDQIWLVSSCVMLIWRITLSLRASNPPLVKEIWGRGLQEHFFLVIGQSVIIVFN